MTMSTTFLIYQAVCIGITLLLIPLLSSVLRLVILLILIHQWWRKKNVTALSLTFLLVCTISNQTNKLTAATQAMIVPPLAHVHPVSSYQCARHLPCLIAHDRLHHRHTLAVLSDKGHLTKALTTRNIKHQRVKHI